MKISKEVFDRAFEGALEQLEKHKKREGMGNTTGDLLIIGFFV